jgi:hypothetical protein
MPTPTILPVATEAMALGVLGIFGPTLQAPGFALIVGSMQLAGTVTAALLTFGLGQVSIDFFQKGYRFMSAR